MAVAEESLLSSTTRESMNKKMKNFIRPEIDGKEIIIAATDIKYARCLSSNEKKVRDRALKTLKKWFELRGSTTPFTEVEFMVLWKGLFYSMWMSDKPLIQEECSESIANLIHSLKSKDAIIYFKCALQTLINEWYGIDRLRLEKFLMFTRRVLRQALFVLKNEKWNFELIKKFALVLEETILSHKEDIPCDLVTHFIEIYLEEVAKVSEGTIPVGIFNHFIVPFMKLLIFTHDARQINRIKRNVFHHLIKQSNIGVKFTEKFNTWKEIGFPGGNLDRIKLMKQRRGDDSDDDNEEEEQNGFKNGVFDPRAGSVHVTLPQIKFNSTKIANLLHEYQLQSPYTKTRREINRLIEAYQKMAKSIYPFGTTKVHTAQPNFSASIDNSAERLMKFDEELTRDIPEEEAHLTNGDEMNQNNAKKGKKRKIFDDKLKRKICNGDEELTSEMNAQEEEEEDAQVTPFNGYAENNQNNAKKGKKRKMLDEKMKRKICNDDKKLTSNGHADVDIDNKSTQKAKKRKVLDESLPITQVLSNCEGKFKRNSGVWFVFNEDNVEKKKKRIKVKKQRKIKKSVVQEEKCKSIDSQDKIDDLRVLLDRKDLPLPTSKEHDNVPESPKLISFDYSNEELAVTPKQFRNASTPNGSSTPFPQSEWDTPLKDGEVEFFVPSKNSRNKSANIQQLLNDYRLAEMRKRVLRGKHRHSFDVNMLDDANYSSSSYNMRKKVKIDLRLNKSQEVHEHEEQLQRSPAIPFDANAKPTKPLLKPNAVASPINPFYKRKLKL